MLNIKVMEKTYTILQLTPALNQGGVERGTIEMANFLAEQGWGSVVASAGGHMQADLSDKVVRLDISMKKKTPLEIYRAYKKLIAYLKEHPVDLIHARSRIPAWVAYFASRKTGIPYLTTYHGTYGMQNVLKRFYNSAMVRGAHVVSISKFIENHIESYFPNHPDMTLAYRGFDVARFQECEQVVKEASAIRHAYNIPEDTPILLLPGRLTRWKGQLDFLKALSKLKDIDFVAILAGGAEERQAAYKAELEAYVKQHHLERKVVFTGNVDKIAPYYYLSHLVVCPSNKPEAFGRVPVEAGAMGRAVVATAHGGALETVRDGETGYHVGVSDISGMAKILRSLLENAPLREKLGQNGKAFVEKTFTLNNMCSAELSAYKKVLKENK